MQHSYVDFLAKSKSPQSSFYFRPVTASEVETEILSIPNKKTYGLYSNAIIKMCNPYKNFSILFVFYTYFIAIIPILILF